MGDRENFEGKNIYVLTPGLPGWGLMDHFYWDSFTFDDSWTKEMNVKLIFVEPGPMSSYHDRACEIFAQLRGQVTDFGQEHSEVYRHNRFGRDFCHKKMLKDYWSEENPISFICHCIGVNTIRYLQYLLAQDYWQVGTNEKWIKSIISINGNINGSQFLHFLGIDSMTAISSKKKLLKSTKKVFNGVVWALNKLKNLTETQKQSAVDWHLEHWNVFTKNKNWFNQMLTKSDIFTNTDNLFYDSTIHGSTHLNSFIPHSYSCTYYISFYAVAAKISDSFQISYQLNPILFAPASYILHTRFDNGLLSTDIYKTHEWCDNDGVYPVASQKFPLNCEGKMEFKSLNSSVSFQKGYWYYGNLQNIIGCLCTIDHFSMVWCRKFLKSEAFQLTEKEQKEFYYNLISKLVTLT